MTDNDFVAKAGTVDVVEGEVSWKAPSNIALVKYWGKKPEQIPANPSISFTLNNCATTTTVKFSKLENKKEDFSFDFFFEGEPKPDFIAKIHTFFERIVGYCPFLKAYHFEIRTANTFPHSSGIASSASGMAALASCLMDIESKLNPGIEEDHFYKKASFLARLGSGSACRSIKGNLVQWGSHENISGSTDLFGISYPYKVHPVFEDYQDTILLVHQGQKKVSSTVGHGLMKDHLYASQRFNQAKENLNKLKEVFEEGDLKGFIEIVESEALSLHAMMMTSLPYFMLMKPNTLEIIEALWAFREKSGLHLCFTLDAGANVHVLYPSREKEEVYQFIKETLLAYCENGKHICDQLGNGAVRINKTEH
ncbi:MAG: diphosphomevalonate/mevalonate 3,5-bisphosphate decarboxylase family protein [Flavobacteriaceae bacterium]